jgi:hypothetical protein
MASGTQCAGGTAQKQEEAHEMSESRLCRRHHRRFTLDERRYVIDLVNADNSGKGYCHEGAPEDDKYLRERVLQARLHEMLEKLIINLRPMQILPSGEEYKPQNEETFLIWWASARSLLGTIAASHLNTFDPALSGVPLPKAQPTPSD